MIANPIDTTQLDKVKPTKEVFFANDYPIVLSMQRFEMEKDNFTIIRSIKETLKINVNFLLLGEEIERELNLVQDLGLENNVLLPGFYADPFNFKKS